MLLDRIASTAEARASCSELSAEHLKHIYKTRAERGVTKAIAGDLQALADGLWALDDEQPVLAGVVYAGAWDAHVFADESRGNILGCMVFPHEEPSLGVAPASGQTAPTDL